MRPITSIAAALLLGAAPLALAHAAGQPAPPGYGQGYDQGYSQAAAGYSPSQQWVPSPPPPGAAPAPNPDQGPPNPNYGQAQDDYQARLRAYQHEKREYDRQRAAYEAQFSGGGGYAYPPPPPPQADWARGQGPGVFRYSETMPFQEGPWISGDHGARWYRDRGCRLASPRGGDLNAMIPVCPDADGRYRPA